MRRLLEELGKLAGAPEPAALAVQLQVLVEGAVAVAVVERHAAHARSIRELANLALLPRRRSPAQA